MLSVSPQQAMSIGVWSMLCIFSVSQIKLSSLFLCGKSCAHQRMNLLRTNWSNITDYAVCAFYALYTIYAYYAMTYCLPSASRSFKSSSSFAGNRLRYRWYQDNSWTVISTIIGDGSEIRPRGFGKLYSSTSSVRRPSRRNFKERHQKQDVAHIHGSYSWWRLTLVLQMTE